MSFSDYAEGKVQQFWFRTGTPTKPSALYVGLLTASPADSATGSSVTEAAYTSYARVQLDPSDSNWSLSGSTISNASAVTFPTCTGSSSTVTHFGVFDASTAGNSVIFGALSTSKSISTGDTPQFAIGALTATLD